MKIVYNKKLKKYELKVSVLDKCITCLNANDCPLLNELRGQNVLLKKGNFYKETCDMYSYFVEPEVEKRFKGYYLGDMKDKGYSDKFKYD